MQMERAQLLLRTYDGVLSKVTAAHGPAALDESVTIYRRYRGEVLGMMAERSEGDRIERLQREATALKAREPTFDWNNTNGEARQRHSDNERGWRADAFLTLMRLIESM